MVKCNEQRTDSVDFLVECRSPEREAAGLKSGDGFPTVRVIVVHLTLAQQFRSCEVDAFNGITT